MEFRGVPNHHKFTNKHYLGNLPQIETPHPDYDDSSHDLVIVYPVFYLYSHAKDFNPNVSDWFFTDYARVCLQSAIWSRNSFLQNTDVVSERVAIKFYLHTFLWENNDIRDFILGQGIKEEDILLDTESSSGAYERYNFLSKKLLVLTDERLDDWKCRIICDVDCFFARDPSADGQYPFCSELIAGNPDRIGVTLFNPDKSEVIYNWHNNTEDGRKGLDYDKALKMLWKYTGTDFTPRPDFPVSDMLANMIVFPTSYHEKYPSFRDFIDNTAQWFGSDENVLGFWKTLHYEDFYEIFRNETSGECILDISLAHSEFDIINFRNNVPFYLTHISSDWEKIWRNAVGVV